MRAGATTLGCHVISTFTEFCRGTRTGCKITVFLPHIVAHTCCRVWGFPAWGLNPGVQGYSFVVQRIDEKCCFVRRGTLCPQCWWHVVCFKKRNKDLNSTGSRAQGIWFLVRGAIGIQFHTSHAWKKLQDLT